MNVKRVLAIAAMALLTVLPSLVQAAADGGDDTGATKFVQRAVAALHDRAEPIFEDVAVADGPEVDVVDEQHVDA